jgi:hypothetical protein
MTYVHGVFAVGEAETDAEKWNFNNTKKAS